MTTPNTPSSRVRIGLLDFEPLRVAGLREILASRANFEVSSADLTASFRKQQFDLVILLARRRAESFVLLGRLKVRHPAMKAIVMAREGDDETSMSAISAGAKGWLEETALPDMVLQAVDIVLSGSIWAPRRVLSQLVDRALGTSGAPLRAQVPRFTEREEEVLQQLVLARSNREIAQALSIQEQTVKSYVARLMRKMGVDNRIALSMQAAEGDWWKTK
ncbi:MAG: response regulator transcription factor [Acidobacteriaceae bacterium]